MAWALYWSTFLLDFGWMWWFWNLKPICRPSDAIKCSRLHPPIKNVRNPAKISMIVACNSLTHEQLEMHGAMHTQRCGYWCPGAEAPGHEYPQCWLNIHCIGAVSYRNIITFIVNSISINQSIKSSFVKGAGAHPQNMPCRRRSHALRSAPVWRGRLLSTVLHRWSPRHSILSAGLR